MFNIDFVNQKNIQYEAVKGIKDMENGNVKTSEEVKEIIKKNSSLVRYINNAYNRVYR